jgi:signal transduction histidine kinase
MKKQSMDSANVASETRRTFPRADDVDLGQFLSAWQAATERLQATHEVLRGEVRRLTDELEVKNRELARKNRLADLGQMASHVAHEVRNELMPITLYASLLRRRLADDGDSLATLAKVETGLNALDSTVNDLLQFTADRDPVWQSIRLRDMALEVCRSLEAQLSAQSVRLRLDIPGDIVVLADSGMIRRALFNLALNALDAMPHGGDLTITAGKWDDSIEIEVADSGPGIDDRSLISLFEPFFTTKSGGTGLGLATVQRAAECHGGSVTAMNCPDGGAAFTIRLPQPAKEKAA